jgi:hypothetical protein
MMKHREIDTGMLRAYLDGEVNAGKGPAVAGHVDDCSDCQAELKTLSSRAASVLAGLEDLPQAAKVDTGAAWRALEKRMHGARESQSIRWTPLRAWSLAAAGTVAVAAALVITVAPIRGWAENLLAIFRVEHVTVLDLNSGSIKGLENDEVFNQAMSRILSEEVTVTEAPRKAQIVPDVATASKLAGFEAHLIAGETPAALMVRSTITAQMKLDRDRLQSIVDESGRNDLRIPSSVDGAVIGIRIPAGIMAKYGNCGGYDLAGRSGENPVNVAIPPADTTCVKLNELPSPTASFPQDLNPAEIAQVGLQFAGLSPTEAANFTQTVDWTTTLVLPVLRGQSSYEQVNVAGRQGVLFRPRAPRNAAEFELVWVDNGIVYGLIGTGDDTTALNLAEKIK